MDDLLHIGTNYWPYMFGALILIVVLVNARSWFKEPANRA